MRSWTLLAVAMAAVVSLTGCTEDGRPAMDRLITQQEGQHSGFSYERNATRIYGDVITTEAQWQEFWSLHRPDGEPAPEVDFSERFVAALFMGDQPTSGYAIAVQGLEYADGQYQVHYKTAEPGPGCMVLQAVTQPNDIVAIDRVHGAGDPTVVTVRDEHVVGECEQQG